MNMTHLRAFHNVANYGSYSGAARAVGLSQPTLSAQIKALESTYGTTLIHRTGRGMELSPTGGKLFALTTEIFGQVDNADALLSSATRQPSGKLRIAADAAIHAVGLMRKLKENYPAITITLKTGNSAQIRAAVLAGTADVGITADSTPEAKLLSRELSRYDLAALVRADSPWAHAKEISIERLNGQQLVMRERGSVTRAVFETALNTANIQPASVVEVEGREGVHAAVLAGLGIGAVGEAEFSHDPQLRILDFSETLPELSEHLIFRKDKSTDALVAAVLSCL